MFALLQSVAFGAASISDDVNLAKKSWVTADPDGGNLYSKGGEVLTPHFNFALHTCLVLFGPAIKQHTNLSFISFFNLGKNQGQYGVHSIDTFDPYTSASG